MPESSSRQLGSASANVAMLRRRYPFDLSTEPLEQHDPAVWEYSIGKEQRELASLLQDVPLAAVKPLKLKTVSPDAHS